MNSTTNDQGCPIEQSCGTCTARVLVWTDVIQDHHSVARMGALVAASPEKQSNRAAPPDLIVVCKPMGNNSVVRLYIVVAAPPPSRCAVSLTLALDTFRKEYQQVPELNVTKDLRETFRFLGTVVFT